MTADGWTSQLGPMARPLAPRFGRALVGLHCPICSAPIALITENRDGLWITRWAPAPWETRRVVAQAEAAGGKTGRIPDYGFLLTRPVPPVGTPPLLLHCARDGAVDFDPDVLHRAIARYRATGRRVAATGETPAGSTR